jgi:hypothetical protein
MNDEPMAPAASQYFSKLPTLAEKHDVLTDKQVLAIELLVQGKSQSAVAVSVEVTRRTLYGWRQDEDFRAALHRRRRELWDDYAERLRALVDPALGVLEAEVHDEYDRSRVRAAGMILRFADLRKHVPPTKEER